ncbi:MAG: RidA family protein [Roseivirga sp.]
MKRLLSTALLLFLAFTACTPAEKTEVSHYQSEEMAALGLPFSDAVIVGDMMYLSGQIGNLPGTLELAPGGIEAEAHQTMKNIQKVLEANGSSFDHAVKLTIMMADIGEWAQFNEIYKQYFPGKKPARSAFGANGLALGARVEIECIAYIPK